MNRIPDVRSPAPLIPLLIALLALGAWTFLGSDGARSGEAIGTPSPEAERSDDAGTRVTPPTVDLREWTVPWEQSRPRDPDVGPDGRVWFVGQVGHYVAYFDPETEEFHKYDLEPGTGPHSVNVSSDGAVWYTGNQAAHLGRLDPETGEITRFSTPSDGAQDPHTHVFAPGDQMWFTNQWGNTIGRLDISTGEVDLVDVPIDGARPYGMDLDSQGRPWIALLGTNKLGVVDPETMELRTVDLPWDGAAPRRLAVGSDDRVYFVDYGAGRVGIYDPADQSFQGWVTPAGENSAPYGMAIDHENRVYFVETDPQPNMFVGFDPTTEEFFYREAVPSGGQTIRNMRYDRATQTVWFGADTNTIGRARIEESAGG